MSLSVSVDPMAAQELTRSLGAVAARANNLKPVNQEALLVVMADVDERFRSAPRVRASGTVYGGATWERLTDAYLNSNPRREGGQQLRDTGELLQSFQIGQRGNVTENRTDGWSFGSALPKARGLRHKRPLVFFHVALIDTLETLYLAYVVGDLDL